ncbi:unnamed protein product [Rotaria sordida]|uniref:Uncharacterized protein n=1 Tax=Rotaria sordida TaxID=392033 RepID=A0A813UBM8_9BILA|nr:unnamed protein product [Rotaria sordida]
MYFSSSTAIREHLLVCGNKTDQCPKCRKFIRRAIFAYHYENDCAYIDEFNDLVSTTSTGFDVSPSTSRLNDALLSSSRHTLNSEQEEWTHSSNQNRDQSLVTRSYPSNFNNSIPCQYCNDNELFDPVQLNDHIKTYHERNDQPLFQRHIKQQCIVTTVPCEYCEMQCQFDDVNIHQVTTFFLLI